MKKSTKEHISFYWYGWILTAIIAIDLKDLNPQISLIICVMISSAIVFIPTILWDWISIGN